MAYKGISCNFCEWTFQQTEHDGEPYLTYSASDQISQTHASPWRGAILYGMFV